MSRPYRGRGAGLAVVVALALAATGTLPIAAEAHVYWTNTFSNTLGRANLDGSSVDQSFVTGANFPEGVAFDASHVYWANYAGGSIARAEIDGSGANQSLITGAASPTGIAVDSAHVYWTNYGANTIGRANLDGSGADQSFVTGANRPSGIAVDSGHVYWANYDGNALGRANLDGSSPDQSFITGAAGPSGVAVDTGHVYWTNYRMDTIGRADLSTSIADQAFITGANAPSGIAVDLDHLYWTNAGTNAISRANLDGSAANPSFIATSGPAAGVAVGPQPPLEASPRALTFGSPLPVPKGTVSPPQTVTYTNTGTNPLVFRGFTFGGTSPGDFLISGDTCRATVAVGSSCSAQVRFVPEAKGDRSATLTGLTGSSADPATSLSGTAGPRPGGSPGKEAKVRCAVSGSKPRVVCRGALANESRTTVRWRLTRASRTNAHGTVSVTEGRFTLHLDRIADLRPGRYVLHVGGRKASRFRV